LVNSWELGPVERVMGASEKELQEVHGIGTEKAKEIKESVERAI